VGRYRQKLGLLFFLQLCFFLGVGLCPHDLQAAVVQPPAPSSAFDLHFTKALFYIYQKQYAEAIDELNAALVAKPNDRDAVYYLGVALLKVGRAQESEEALKKVMMLDPNYAKAHFDLGIAEYELGKYADAIQELERAEMAGTTDALLYQYQGLAYYHLEDYARSSALLLRAASLSPDFAPTAHFYAGLGYFRRGMVTEARQEFTKALQTDQSSPVARAAKAYLSQLEPPPEKTVKHWDLAASMAYQYDSNVVLTAGGSTLPEGIARQGDSRLVFYLNGVYRFLETADWTMGAGYAFYQNLQNQLRSFNVQSREGRLFLEYRQPWGQLRLPYVFNYVQVGGSNTYLSTHALTPTMRLLESPITYTEVQYGYTSKVFKNSTDFPNNSDMNADNHLIGIAQAVVLNKTGLLRIGYNYDSELAAGSTRDGDWTYQGSTFFGTLTYTIPEGMKLEGLKLEGLKFDLEASYDFRDYYNPNSYASPPYSKTRADDIQLYRVALSKAVGQWVTLSLQYLYNQNASNIPDFDYNRSIVSAIVEGNF
jgi:Flp pilus assembly protein TadD